MATKLYAIGVAPKYSTGHNNTRANGSASGWDGESLLPTPGAATRGFSNTSTVTGPTNGVEVTSSFPSEFFSPPLAADVTISGTITFNIWGYESNMSANVTWRVIVEKVDGATGAITTICNVVHPSATELAVTTPGVLNWTGTPTSTAMKRGDRFRARFLGDDSSASTMATGFNFVLQFEGPTTGASGDTYIQFTETITFESETATPSGSQVFFTDSTSPVTAQSPAGTAKNLSLSRVGSVASAASTTAGGWQAPGLFRDGSTSPVEWYTAPLAPFTLGGIAKAVLRAQSAGINGYFAVEIAVCNGDGSGAVVWGLGRPGDGQTGAGIQATEADCIIWVAGDDISVTAGQRLRFRIYIDDSARTPLTSGQVANFYYSGAAGATGDSYIILPQTLALSTNLEQKAYRFRNDDGSETTATWKAAANTPVTTGGIALGSVFRCRFLIQNDDSASYTDSYVVQYNRKPAGGSFAGWTDAGTLGIFRIATSSNFTDGDPTTQQLGAGTFTTGEMGKATSVVFGPITIPAGNETEIELALVTGTGMGAGDQVQIRLRKNSDGLPLDVYTQTADFTIPAAASTPVSPAATLTLSATMTSRKSAPRLNAASLTMTPAVIKKVTKPVASSLVLTPAVVKKVTKPPYAVGLTLTGAMVKAKTSPVPISAGLTLTGALSRVMVAPRLISASLVLTAAIATDISKFFRLLAATLTLTPVQTDIVKEYRALPAGLTLTGAMANPKLAPRALSASLVLTGALSRVVRAPRAISASLTLTPAMQKKITDLISVGLTLTPSMTNVMRAPRAVIASLVLTPTIQATPVKVTTPVSLPASLTLSPTLARVMAAPRLIAASLVLTAAQTRVVKSFRSLPATLTLTGAMTPRSLRLISLPAGLTLTGALTKFNIRPVALPASLTLTGTVTRVMKAPRLISATLVLTPTMANRLTAVRAISATLTLTGALALQKKFARAVPATLTITPLVANVKIAPRPMPVGLTLTAAFLKKVTKPMPLTLIMFPDMQNQSGGAVPFNAVLILTASMQRRITRPLAASLTFTSVIQKFQAKTFPISLTLAPTMTRVVKAPRAFAATLTLTPTMARVQRDFRTLSTGLTLTPTLAQVKGAPRALAASLTLSGTMARVMRAPRSFNVTMTVTPSMTRVFKAFRPMAITLTITPVMRKAKPQSFTVNLPLVPTMQNIHPTTEITLAATFVLIPSMDAIRRSAGTILLGGALGIAKLLGSKTLVAMLSAKSESRITGSK